MKYVAAVLVLVLVAVASAGMMFDKKEEGEEDKNKTRITRRIYN